MTIWRKTIVAGIAVIASGHLVRGEDRVAPWPAVGAYPEKQTLDGLVGYYGMTPTYLNYGLSGTFPYYGGYGYQGAGPGPQFGAHYLTYPPALGAQTTHLEGRPITSSGPARKAPLAPPKSRIKPAPARATTQPRKKP